MRLLGAARGAVKRRLGKIHTPFDPGKIGAGHSCAIGSQTPLLKVRQRLTDGDIITFRRIDMFKGFFSAMLIITGFLVVLPALMILALEGPDWLEQWQLMSPIL